MATQTTRTRTTATPPVKSSPVVQVTNAAITNAVGKTSTSTTMSNIWTEVLNDHLAKLSNSDRQLCVPIPCHAVIDDRSLKAAFTPIRHKYESGNFHKFLDKVNLILEHVLSFGRAIDVAVGGGDLGAGLIWGGIRILLAVSTRTMSLHGKIIEYLDVLASYLPLFERWTNLFHPSDYTELVACIKITCAEFFNYMVDSILFFRKSAFLNFFKVLFKPKLENQFKICHERIERQTKHLHIEVSTAGLEDSKKRDTSIMALIQTSSSTAITGLKVTFPLRFIQNAPRNDQFFGREDLLIDVNSRLSPQIGDPRMRSVVIYGLGGSGKSSIAKEYMYREYNAGKFEVIIWMYADSKDKLETQFIALARHIGIKTVESEARHSVLCWINNLGKEFLLVFDNADDPTFLRPYWPNTTCGSVLVTSRNPKTQDEGFANTGIPLKAFGDSEGSSFLKSMLPYGFQTDKDDIQAITTLSQRFGGLPLALRQAGSFMKNKTCHPARFLRLYEQKFEDIDGYQVEGHDKTVATTWTVSTSTLSEDSRILLDALSLLDPDSIPADMFDVTQFRSSYATFLDDQLKTVNAQEGLTQQSLVDYDHSSKSFSIHRHLQHITYVRLRKDLHRLQHTADFILHLMDRYIPDIGFTAVRHPHHWRYVEKTLSHIQCIHGRCSESNNLVEAASSRMLTCLTKVLCYAFESAQYPLGEWAFEQGVTLSRNISNPDHEVLSLMYLLFARLCGEMSRAQEGLDASIQAEKHILRAAKTNPKLLKTGQYSRILTNLGIMHTDLGNWDEALKWHNLAVQTCVQLGKQKEFSLGNLRQNLAGTYLWKGDLQKAEELVRLALTEPNTSPMGATYTLGNVLWKQNRIEEALKVHKQTLLDYSASLGANHPVTANSWRKMGSLFQTPGHPGYDLQESERCFRQAYDIWKAQSIKHNNDSDMYLARAQCWLGHVLEQLGSHHAEESEKLKEEAREFLQNHFGAKMPTDRSMTTLFEEMVFYWDR